MSKNLYCNTEKMQDLEKALGYLIEALIDILNLDKDKDKTKPVVDELKDLAAATPILDADKIKRHAYALAQIFFSSQTQPEVATEENEDITMAKADSPPFREICSSMVEHLDAFTHANDTERNSSLFKMIDEGENIDVVLRAILDLIIHVREIFLEERSRAFKHISKILKSLEETDICYINNINSSHKYIDTSEAKFAEDMESGLNELGYILDKPENTNLDVLCMHLFEKVGSLKECLQNKKENDRERASMLDQERQVAEQRMAKSRRDYEAFSRQSHEMLQEIETLRAVSLKDPLTEIYNRRAYDSQISKTISDVNKGILKTCSLLVFDIDHFRDFNNNYGHLAGDKVLTYVARVTKDTLRSDDLIFRYGGDEFVILMPNATVDNAVVVGEKIRTAINALEFKLSKNSESTIKITLSMGVAQIKNDDDPSTFFSRSDQAMYMAKTRGRNQVCKVEN